MHEIRPFQLFTLIDAPASERIAHVQIPSRRAVGGVTLLETFCIVAASQIVRAKLLFEFGTYFGSTTLNLALNAPDDARVLTLDLDEDCAREVNQDIADAPLTKTHLASKMAWISWGSPVGDKIAMLTGNSVSFDFSAHKGLIDFVFIDGGHDLQTVRSDTENAFRMTCAEKPACVMWHDYGNTEYPELTGYLDALSRERTLFHVGDTMLCVWFHDPANSIQTNLLKPV